MLKASDDTMIGIAEKPKVVTMTSHVIIKNVNTAKSHTSEVTIDIGKESTDIGGNFGANIHVTMEIMLSHVLPG